MELKTIDIQQLGEVIRVHFPDIAFAYLFGSAQDGSVNGKSDIDIAIYYKGNDVFIRFRVEEQLENIFRYDIPIDIVELQKTSNSILAFEALRGKMLFVRDECMDDYLDFYTLTCRKHEDDIYWMKKRLEYRGYEVQWDY